MFRHYKKFEVWRKKFTKINRNNRRSTKHELATIYKRISYGRSWKKWRGATFHWKKIGKNENRLCNGNMLRIILENVSKEF